MTERIELALTVERHLAGTRADIYLSTRIPRLSRSRARRIIAAGDLRRQQQPLKPSSRVREGEQLTLQRTLPEEPEAPEDFAVIAEQNGLMVIDKPAGLTIHPTARYFRTTITQLMLRQGRAVDGFLPRPCHRLDRETSGVLVLACNRSLERQVKQAFFRGLVSKTYWALVEGTPEQERFSVDIPLAPGGSAIRIRMCEQADAPAALTHFRLLRRLGSRSLLACYPKTGRTHQIRAHLGLAGYPIVGDKIYGAQGESWFLRWAEGGEAAAPVSELSWPRHCLHAHELTLPPLLDLPQQTYRAAWPQDLPPIDI